MALISLIAAISQNRTSFRENTTEKDILIIDATISRSTSYENEVTMFPVESGPDVTDHVRTKPITMNIDGVISETPLSLEAQKASLVTSGTSAVNKSLGGFKGASALTGAVGGKIGAKLFQSSNTPAELGRALLESFIYEKKLIRVAVGKKFLDNMVMTRLSIPEDNQTGRAFKFSCTLQQIRVVSGESIQITKIAAPVAHTASKKTNLGSQATTEAKPQQRASIAAKLFGGG
jgi:hypothetical protein